jgi:hypothetical protein
MMIAQTAATTPSGTNLLGLILVGAFTFWCWFGAGPRLFRWISLVVLVLVTSGHWIGNFLGVYISSLVGPLLPLFLVGVGLMIMLRGFGRHRRRQPYGYGRRWGRDDRW